MDSIRNPDRIVKKTSETYSDGNRFSVRQKQDPTMADMLKKEVEKRKGDVEKLKELLKLQRSITGGTKFTASSVEAAARVLKAENRQKVETRKADHRPEVVLLICRDAFPFRHLLSK